MGRNTDWLPHTHEGIHALVQRLINYITDTANRDRMDFSATSRTGKWFTDVFLPAVAKYLPVYTAWEDPAQRSPARQEALQHAEKELLPLVRELYTSCIKNSLFVTADDLSNMSLPPRRAGGGKASPVADKPPGARVELLDGDRVRIHFFDIENNKKAKPAGQHGPEIVYGVFDNDDLVDPEDLPHSTFDTRTPKTIQLSRKVRGQYLKVALRWENTRGEKGPWSEVFIVIIP